MFQNKDFIFLSNKEFREKILTEINSKHGFDAEDEFITTSDLILKINLNENRMHVWSLIPNVEEASLIRTLMEIKDNKEKLLQEIILQ